MTEDIEIDWHLCRHTRTGKLSLLGIAPINSPVRALLSHDDDEDWQIGGLTVSGGGVWTAHTIEEFGDDGEEWVRFIASEMAKEMRRLEELGILPKERPDAD